MPPYGGNGSLSGTVIISDESDKNDVVESTRDSNCSYLMKTTMQNLLNIGSMMNLKN